MVYDWKDKKDECYRLYVEERKSLHEVMQYFKDRYNFEPRYGRRRVARVQIALARENTNLCNLLVTDIYGSSLAVNELSRPISR